MVRTLNSLVLLSLLTASAVVPAKAAPKDGEGIYLAAKAKLLEHMKTCEFADPQVKVENFSTPTNIGAIVSGDRKTNSEQAVACLADKFASNNGYIDFLYADIDREFDILRNAADLRQRRAALDKMFDETVSCGIDKADLARDVGDIEQSVSLIVATIPAAIGEDVMRCIAIKSLDQPLVVDFKSADAQSAYYVARGKLWAQRDLAKALEIFATLKLRGKFKPFDPKQMKLAAYGKKTETLCGAKSGQFLKLFERDTLAWKATPSGLEEFPELAGKAGCVWTLLTLAKLEEHGASFGRLMQVSVQTPTPMKNETENPK